MYASDEDIRALLERMNVRVEDSALPFNADDQVQPSSIDLRLSNVFWRPSLRARLRRIVWRREALDLRRSHLHELEPRRDWKKMTLKQGESLTLKPGKIILGRILERFEIPPEYAGKIEGRSSFARMGLMVHCTGDFVNPGWSGYMPLQLFNAGPVPLRIFPYLPICQLMLVKLTSPPTRTYGHDELQSKYINDDGGPSYWWRDARVQRLQEHLAQTDLSQGVIKDIVGVVRFQDPDLLERFERFVLKQRGSSLESADAILDEFGRREDRRRWFDRAGKAVFPALFAALIGGPLFASPYGVLHLALAIGTLIALPWALFASFLHPAEYLGAAEIRTARSQQTADVAVST